MDSMTCLRPSPMLLTSPVPAVAASLIVPRSLVATTTDSRALKAAGIARESVVVATKLRGTMSDAATAGTGDVNNMGLGRKHVMESIDASLRRLGTDYVDLYQIHGID